MLYIGSDHRGYNKKSEIIEYFKEHNLEYQDFGAYKLDEQDDFNDSAIAVAKAVRKDTGSFGVLICGSAHGMVIQANRFKGIRAITSTNSDLVRLGREHNDANILCLSADFLSLDEMTQFIEIFLNTKPIEGEKYSRRIKRLDEREDYA